MPRLLAYLILSLVMLTAPGVVRFLTHWDIKVAIGLIGAITLAALIKLATAPRPSESAGLGWLAIGATFIGSFLYIQLGKGPWGLYTLGGCDAGAHVAQFAAFIERDPSIYQGFVSFYGTAAILTELLGLPLYQAIAIAVYSLAILTLLLVSFAIGSAFEKPQRSVFFWLGLCAAALFVTMKAIGPFYYYNVGEGFWPHIGAFIVLAAAWAAYTALQSPMARICSILVAVGLLRFTYGINVPDLMITAACIVLFESNHFANRLLRIGAGMAAVTLVGGAIFGYSKLLPLNSIGGGVAHHDLTSAVIAQALVIIAATAVATLHFRQSKDHKTLRHFIFPLVFSGTVVVGTIAYLSSDLPKEYYIHKYGLHGAMLCAAIIPSTVVLGIRLVVTALPKHRLHAAIALVAVAMAIHGTERLAGAYHLYRKGLTSWMAQKPGYHIDPLFTPEIIESINRVLQQHDKQFHALLGTQWAGIIFLNSYFLGKSIGHSAIFRAFTIMQEPVEPPPPGSCSFWLPVSPYQISPLFLPTVEPSVDRVRNLPGATCDSEVGEVAKFRLCYLCQS